VPHLLKLGCRMKLALVPNYIEAEEMLVDPHKASRESNWLLIEAETNASPRVELLGCLKRWKSRPIKKIKLAGI